MAPLEDEVDRGEITLMWRTVGDRKVCQNPSLPGFSGEGGCRERHGVGGLTLDEWEANGLPGSGWSDCGGNCRCILMPESIIDVEAEILEPFEIDVALAEVPDEEDPLEQNRIATNVRLFDEFPPGQRVRYTGPMMALRGQTAVVTERISPSQGVKIQFENPVPGFQEFVEPIQVFDLTDIVALGGE